MIKYVFVQVQEPLQDAPDGGPPPRRRTPEEIRQDLLNQMGADDSIVLVVMPEDAYINRVIVSGAEE